MKKNEKTKKPGKKGLFKTRVFRSGGYSVVLSLVVAAVIVAINLFVSEIT